MIPALSTESHERGVFTALGMFTGSLGYNGITVVVIPIVSFFSGLFASSSGQTQAGWTAFGAIIAVLGLIAIILAVCSATVWRPGATAEATLASAPAQNYVVTQPGVLNRIDSKVTVTATAASGDDQVFLAVGHSADVNAWLANDPYVSVTGMDSWDRLSATDVTTRCGDETAPAATPGATAEATASDAPTAAPSTDANGCTVLEASGADPTNSDLWLTTASDKGSVALDLDAADTDLVVLAATDGASPAPGGSDGG